MRVDTRMNYREINLLSITGVSASGEGSQVETLGKPDLGSGERGVNVGIDAGARFFLNIIADGGGTFTATVRAVIDGVRYDLFTFSQTSAGTESIDVERVPEDLIVEYTIAGSTGVDAEISMVRF